MPMSNAESVRLATEAAAQKAADQAINDPKKLARAARIVRTALERNRLTLADLLPADHELSA